MVKIYTTTYCPYCKMAKEYFTKKNVAFEEYNVENDEKALEEMVRKSGQMGVPVIEINGTIIIGFDREAIDEALEANK
ncbi:MAG: NrdH-redoxin [Candidatus Parcubacteria bacterium]|nr:glutaredoxin family protein [Patescibacteria group bacterium]BCX15950.1 MAG: NrdH-redoxin [Candidatus Parcubacteria bacterium]